MKKLTSINARRSAQDDVPVVVTVTFNENQLWPDVASEETAEAVPAV